MQQQHLQDATIELVSHLTRTYNKSNTEHHSPPKKATINFISGLQIDTANLENTLIAKASVECVILFLPFKSMN